jgi:hypothetical protein
MRSDTVPGCALELSPAILSAWHDGALPAAETQRILAHIAACSACQNRLAEYDTIAGKLAAIRVSEPVGGYGQSPRADLAATRADNGKHPRRVAGGLGALAAVVLLTLLFAQLFHSMGGRTAPTATGSPTATTAPTATGTSNRGQASLPPGLTPGVLDTRPVPAGWTRVLDGQVFNGIATSPADPHTLAGCPLPAQLAAVAAAAPPVLVLSTDGGVTWQSHPIPGADQTTNCVVMADTEHAGTFIVDTNDAVYETTDTGQTWQTLTPPSGYTMSLYTGSTSLVGGYLTAALTASAGTTGLHLGQRSPDGTWTSLHTFDAGDYPTSLSVDPDNPAHIYAAVPLSPIGMALIVTTDRGSTWQTVQTWQTATRCQVWTATAGRVLVEADVNAKVPHEVWFSPDAGASWREVATNGYSGQTFVEPDSDMLTLYSGNPSSGSLSELNLASGTLQPIASSPAFFDIIFCTKTTGALVCGDVWGTYRLPQAPAS